MIEPSNRAIDFAAQQSAQEQADAKWNVLFADPRSDALLERLVAEAIAEDNAGETEEIIGPGFLS